MSNNQYWDDEDDDFESEASLSENDLLKKLRKAKRADEKRIKDLTDQLESLTKVQREKTVTEVLAKKGVSPKAARLILKDLDGDFSEESVANWLEDNAELFGLKVDEPQQDNTNLAALRQQDIVSQSAVTPDRAEDFELRMNNASSAEELISMLRSQQ
jgi:hypothetical protein